MIKYFTIKNFLSIEETKKILEFSKQNLKLKAGTVGDFKIDESIRKSSVAFINYDSLFTFLKPKLIKEISQRIQLKGYEINFNEQPFQFTEYKLGEYYDWHTDSSTYGRFSERYCSVVIQLNDEYTGGNLQMQPDENKEIIEFENGIGNLFVFLSSIKHKVTTVESGTRYSLVSWFSLKPISNYKKTII